MFDICHLRPEEKIDQSEAAAEFRKALGDLANDGDDSFGESSSGESVEPVALAPKTRIEADALEQTTKPPAFYNSPTGIDTNWKELSIFNSRILNYRQKVLQLNYIH